MDEFSLIELIKQKYYKQSSLIKGIGDDAAVFKQTSKNIVTAVDTFVENVHFSRKTMPSYYIGYRALAANISDLAAMGSSPTFYLVSVVVPDSWLESDIISIFSGMKDLASTYDMDLIGGDTVSGDQLVLTITVIGFAKENSTRFRHCAKKGDIVFVTGTLGDSQAGLYTLINDKLDIIERDYFIQKHQAPFPRVNFARSLAAIPRISLNDISDGIANEASEIAEASNVSITIEADNVPISPYFIQFPAHLRNKWVYFGGEDFELVGTVPSKDWDQVKLIAEKTETPISKIGYVTESRLDNGKVFLYKNNRKKLLDKKGYIHMNRR